MVTSNVFSEAEVVQIGIKVKGATKADINECVGSMEEEMTVKTVTKKCRGIVTKSRTKGTGTGTVKLTLHMPQDMFADLYGMQNEDLKDGVIGHGKNSAHATFCMTAKVIDEDEKVKYKAYPECTIQSSISRKVENGAEEIAEIEVEIAVMPDENGYGLYEAVESDLTDESVKTAWMESFTPELVKAVSA